MSIETMAVVLHHSRAKGTDKLVLLGIANHDGDGGAWPSVATLATYANCDPRSVQRAVARLVQLGEVTVDRNAGGTADRKHYERPNLYRVTVECPPECDRSTRHRIAQPGLWINPVTSTSGGDAHATTPGDAHATQTTTSNPDANHLPASVTGDVHAMPPCAECSLSYVDCVRRSRTSGHSYRTTHRDPADVLARVRRQYDDMPHREDQTA